MVHAEICMYLLYIDIESTSQLQSSSIQSVLCRVPRSRSCNHDNGRWTNQRRLRWTVLTGRRRHTYVTLTYTYTCHSTSMLIIQLDRH